MKSSTFSQKLVKSLCRLNLLKRRSNVLLAHVISLLAGFLGGFAPAAAQRHCDTSNIVVQIDAITGMLTNPKALHHGKFITFWIKNVNPLLARPTAEVTSFTFTTDVPLAFSGEVAKPEAASTIKAISNPKYSTGIKIPEVSNEFLTQTDAFKTAYARFVKAATRLMLLTKIEKYVRGQLKEYIIDSATTKRNLKGYLDIFRQDFPDTTPAFIQSLRNASRTDIDSMLVHFQIMNVAYDVINKSPISDKIDVSGKLTDKDGTITLDVSKSAVAIKRKPIFQDEYVYAQSLINQLKVDSVQAQIVTSVNSGLDLYESIMNSPMGVAVGPYEMDQDSKEFAISLKDAQGKSVKDFPKITVRSCGQLKVDFSSGYLLSFTGDDDYATLKDVNGKTIGFKADDRDKLTHSVGALFNVYKQSASGMSLGGSVGFSLPTDDKFNFYLGPSALFLDKNRLVITAGLSFVQVKKLRTALLKWDNNTGSYLYIQGNDLAEATYKKIYKAAPFFAITYNIFNVAKSK
jgi:hypothetical protein